MKRLLVLSLLIVITACSTPKDAVAPITPAQPEAPQLIITSDAFGRYANNQLIVGFDDSTSLESIATQLDATILQEWSRLHAGVLELPSRYSAKKAESLLRSAKGVRYTEFNRLHDIEPDYPHSSQHISETQQLISQATTISDPDFYRQWMHRQMNTQKAWELGATGKGIRIGIHDDYVDHRHPDLVDNVFYPGLNGNANTLINADTPHDGAGTHGSSVAGTAAASANAIGGRGIAYEASIVPLAINEPVDAGLTTVGIVNSAIFAVEGPDGKSSLFDEGDSDSAPGAKAYVHVVNMSWGGSVYSQLNKDAMDYMLLHGIVLVTSAGNSPISSFAQPAWFPGLITVAATTARDERTAFSNRGRHLNVAAPGERVWVTTTRNCVLKNGGSDTSCGEDDTDYTFINGTSFSSPATAGAAALILDAAAERDSGGNITKIGLTPAQVRHILQDTAYQPNGDHFNHDLGFGIVDAGAAVQLVKDKGATGAAKFGATLLVKPFTFDSNFNIVDLSNVAITLLPQGDNPDAPIYYAQSGSGALLNLIDPDGATDAKELFEEGIAVFSEIEAGAYAVLAGGPSEYSTGLKPDREAVVVNLAPGSAKVATVYLNVALFEDKLEPNNKPDEAYAATVGTTIKAGFNTAEGGDIDFYSFEATKDVTYNLNTEKLSGTPDIVLAVGTLDSAGKFQVMVENDNNQAASLGTDAAITFKATETGTHYIRVTEKDDSVGPALLYALDIATLVGAEVEPNGTADVSSTNISNVVTTDAQSITIGDALKAELATEDDDDIFAVALAEKQTLVVDIETVENGSPDTMVFIYNAAGESVADNDDFTGRESRVQYEATEAGTYYIVVVSWDNSTKGEYILSATALDPVNN